MKKSIIEKNIMDFLKDADVETLVEIHNAYCDDNNNVGDEWWNNDEEIRRNLGLSLFKDGVEYVMGSVIPFLRLPSDYYQCAYVHDDTGRGIRFSDDPTYDDAIKWDKERGEYDLSKYPYGIDREEIADWLLRDVKRRNDLEEKLPECMSIEDCWEKGTIYEETGFTELTDEEYDKATTLDED